MPATYSVYTSCTVQSSVQHNAPATDYCTT